MAVATDQIFFCVQFSMKPEGTRVVDHPELPFLGDQQVSQIAVRVVDQLIEDPHAIDLPVPRFHIRHLDLLRVAFPLAHQYAVDPPGEGRALALEPPLHRDGDHAQA
ncbi:MAG: hypothetical protein O6850_00235 [Acidobacteria bacterium]|nr:hypothetical protein [Acidobacteriota bacterium]